VILLMLLVATRGKVADEVRAKKLVIIDQNAEAGMSDRALRLLVVMTAVWLFLGFGTASAEWVADLYGGTAIPPQRHDLKAGDTTFRDVEFDRSLAVGGRVGYWLADPEFYGVAVDIAHFQPDIGSQSVRSSLGVTPLMDLHLRVITVSIDLMIRVPLLRSPEFPAGRLQPYFAVGPTVFLVKAVDTSNFGPPGNQSKTSANPGFNVGGGVAWQLHKHLALFGEYRYLKVNSSLDFKPDKVEVPISSHLLIGGISFRF